MTTAISAKSKDQPHAITCNYHLGTNLATMVERFGEDVVFNKAKQSIIIDAQSMIRRAGSPNKDGVVKSHGEIQTMLDAWKPDNRVVVKQSAAEKATNAITSMSAEERKELLKKLKAEGLV